MIKLKEILLENTKEWTEISTSNLSDDELLVVYDMFKETYKKMKNITKMVTLNSLKKLNVWILLFDKNKDNSDAFILFKKKSMGNKIHLLGSKNNIVAKYELMMKLKQLLFNGGWFIEGGRKIDDFCIKYNIPYVEDMKIVAQIIKPSKIDSVLPDGYYKRKAAFGVAVKKRLYGVYKGGR